MLVIDADAHVVETEDTWNYMDPAEERFRPLLVASAHEIPSVPPDVSLEEMLRRPSYFVCGDQVFPTATVTSRHYPAGAQFPTDVAARLQHMDQLGIDVQVLFPSVFLDSAFRSIHAERAMARSYNRWIAEMCSANPKRLRWVVVIAPSDIEFSLQQMESARRQGACGVFMRGYDNDRMIDDPVFHPIFAKAAELDMPITIHSGIATPSMKRMVHGNHANFAALTLPVLAALAALHKSAIPTQFPTLRFGFLEATASWIPFAVYRADAGWNTAPEWQLHRRSFLEENRFFVTLEPFEDIPMLLSYGAEDRLMVATDYGHSDSATAIMAHQLVARRTDISPLVIGKLNSANAAAFYGFDRTVTKKRTD